MTRQSFKSPNGMNPILAAIRDASIDLSKTKEIVLLLDAYENEERNPDAKHEILPDWFNRPTELWKVESIRTHLVYVIEKHRDCWRVRLIQIKDLQQCTFKEYMFPQKEGESTLVIE